MKPLRLFLTTLAVVIAAGTIASAATGGVHGKPTRSPSPAISGPPSREPTQTQAPESVETEASDTEATSDETGSASDFSACVGLTGLDNAICRHEALLEQKPGDPGLVNSLGHLRANAAARAAREAAKAAGTHRNSGSHGKSGP